MAQIIWSKRAVIHLHKIVIEIAKESRRRALAMRARLTKYPTRLIRFPLIGAPVPEFDVDHIRELFVRPHDLSREERSMRHCSDHSCQS